MLFDLEMIRALYAKIPGRVARARKMLNRPLTLAEKIIYSHLIESGVDCVYQRGANFAEFHPDRVAMQDATAQMALLQFMTAGKAKTAVPSSVHCDHLITARDGVAKDLPRALEENKEVYAFLESVSAKYGIDFWKPGAGIIHQVVLENYAVPGGMMIGTDSHTVNAGGLGMLAIGVGGADAVDAMVDLPWELKYPKIIGVKLTGKLSGFASAKDVILKLAGILTVKGGTNAIIEYFGEGARSLSATGKATIANMGAEAGATCSTFGYDDSMERYLKSTGREAVALAANKIAEHLRADAEIETAPEKYFDRVIEINLSELKPHYNGPFSPDRAFSVENMSESLKEFNSPAPVSAALIGSCTNSSYEDLYQAANLIRQALEKGLKPKVPLIINPGSELVRHTAERDGIMAVFEKFGATIMTNACGPCIGMWDRLGADKKELNSIVHSFNRNFAKRADGNPNTHAFVCSPEMAVIAALSGSLLFNPDTDSLTNERGESVRLTPPETKELPEKGFEAPDAGYQAPAKDGSAIQVRIPEKSDRLQALVPFAPWDGKDPKKVPLLIKVKGKCTTDHISMAGPWLKYRGHLENISRNLLIGATNAFNGETNRVQSLSGEWMAVPDLAKYYRDAGLGSIVIGDENYGEGSSREHAAMEPRFLGVKAVIVKSFARIHETNLKKQGMLALTFETPADYDKIREKDQFDILGLETFAPGKPFTLMITHEDGTFDEIFLLHTYNNQQWEWFKAGSALNLIRG
ncbi:MAG: aconitate hydratase [Fibrobacter sp.]|jgi:aconitate hydratase|nr:aconitate hydratase [Fibrobacter sp.]